MTEQLTGYEASSVAEIGAILDASPADADTVYLETIAYSERAIAAVAAKRAGSGGGSFNGGTITQALLIKASSGVALKVTDDTGNDHYLNVNSQTGGIVLSAAPASGHSTLNITPSALTFTDETGATPLDIEGGFTSLGPAGELAVTSGQIYAVLPTSDPGNPGQLYSLAGVVHVSL